MQTQKISKTVTSEAAKSLEAGNLEDVHKKVWIARGQLLKVHSLFEKKQRKP